MVPLGAGVNGFLRWKELGLDTLLPIDEEAEKKAQAEQARKMANGAPSNHQTAAPAPQPAGVQHQAIGAQTEEEGDEEGTEGDDDEEEEEEVEAATEVDDDSLRVLDSQDLLSSDY